ncbi:jg2637 [Pararge aegeria aegeria]|uniref:Jg2637 protein n=1 Tax=Pararge aegeria aegeria TaxID=348720 RepID=A0A8S4RQJ6_9NEOP|nr:jg2637 [Pararge aegeria aegeria]
MLNGENIEREFYHPIFKSDRRGAVGRAGEMLPQAQGKRGWRGRKANGARAAGGRAGNDLHPPEKRIEENEYGEK